MKISTGFMMVVMAGMLSGCATLDGFLTDLGLKKTEPIEKVTLVAINQRYETIKNANVRAAPHTQAALVGSLKAGQLFLAVGKTADNWIGISDNSKQVLGYVHGSLVRPYEPKKKTKSSVEASKPTSSPSTGVNLDEVPSSQPKQGVNLDEL